METVRCGATLLVEQKLQSHRNFQTT